VKKLIVAALFLMPVGGHAAAGDMSVASFLTKADALKKKGILALGSADIKLLKAEMGGATSAYRSRIETDKKAGSTPHSCPPQKASMSSDQLLAHFRSYPVAQRSGISVRTAFFDLMKKRYPCS
jgi:hypothetical protein